MNNENSPEALTKSEVQEIKNSARLDNSDSEDEKVKRKNELFRFEWGALEPRVKVVVKDQVSSLLEWRLE